eukprot:SAG31_NODE_10827_length_1093_cov_0.996982_1_plen_128_part_00
MPSVSDAGQQQAAHHGLREGQGGVSVEEPVQKGAVLRLAAVHRQRRPAAAAGWAEPTHGDTVSISALHLAMKVPYFSNSGHKNEKVTPYLHQPRHLGRRLRCPILTCGALLPRHQRLLPRQERSNSR